MSLDSKKTMDQVKVIIAFRLDLSVEEITGDSQLKNLGVSSLDIVQIIIAIQKKFNIEFKGDDLFKMKNVNDIVERICQSQNSEN